MNQRILFFAVVILVLSLSSTQADLMMVYDNRSVSVDPGASISKSVQDFEETFDAYVDVPERGYAEQYSYYTESGDLYASGQATVTGWANSFSRVTYGFDVTEPLSVDLYINLLDGGGNVYSAEAQLYNNTLKSYVFRIFADDYEDHYTFDLDTGFYYLTLGATATHDLPSTTTYDVVFDIQEPQVVPTPTAAVLGFLGIGTAVVKLRKKRYV